MINVIDAQGYKITIEGHDFSGRESDFDIVCSAIERMAAGIDEIAIAAIAWDIDGDCYTDPSDTRMIASVKNICRLELTRLGWDNPDVPFVTISARLR